MLAERNLGAGAAKFGTLLGAIGVGAAGGPILASPMVRDIRRPVWLFGPHLLGGLVDLILASVANFGSPRARSPATGGDQHRK
ncbi:MAG: hypothetical protein ACYC1D_17275 [Acidimicrobiales bacterium]